MGVYRQDDGLPLGANLMEVARAEAALRVLVEGFSVILVLGDGSTPPPGQYILARMRRPTPRARLMPFVEGLGADDDNVFNGREIRYFGLSAEELEALQCFCWDALGRDPRPLVEN